MPFIHLPILFFFLPAALAFHFLAARFGERARLCALILASFAFCAVWDVHTAILLGCSIAVNYGVGRLLEQACEEERELQGNLLLAFGVLFNLGVLAAFRYAEFLIPAFTAISDEDFVAGKMLMPLGVLFFSCDQIAYLADLRRGKTYKADILHYVAFAAFFPRLAAGPLLRYDRIASQWARRPDAEDLAIGLTTFTIGWAKTVLLAGAVAPFAAMVFSAAGSDAQIDFFAGWTGLFAFACQIYFDLSGYSDMAIGLARCFGFKLPVNFRSPYRATNIADFWRSWNITLSDFLRDYVYRPLGGSRHGVLRGSFSLLVAMIAGGLWYGGSAMLLAWGMLHAVFLLAYRSWRLAPVVRNDAPPWIGTVITFAAVMLAWIVFRSSDPVTAFKVFAALFGQNGAVLPIGHITFLEPLVSPLQNIGIHLASTDWRPLLRAWGSILICLVVIFALPNTETLLSSHLFIATEEERSRKQFLPLRWSPSPFWSLALGALAFGCLISSGYINPLLHWHF